MKVFGIIKDATKEMPIASAKVGLYIREKELAVLYSDSEGKFEHKEAAQYIGETLICKVQKEGFKAQEVSYKIEQDEVPLGIELVSEEKEEKIEISHSVSPPSKWPKIAIVIGAFIILAIVVYLLIPKDPEIQYFNADPMTINKGQSSTLRWGTSKAKRIVIEPEIGNVGTSGERSVSPNQTTTYTLIAENKAGSDKKGIRIKVFELNTNRPGLDYKNFNLPAANFELCRDQCEREPRCKAWTYVKPGIQGPSARCWLKYDIPNPTMNFCCVSGIK